MNDTERFAIFRRFFGVITQPRTYGNIAYIWLGFPLGLLYFIVLVTGTALSIGLSLLWIGFIVMLALVLSIWALAHFERVLSEFLLGERLPMHIHAPERKALWPWLKDIVKNPTTWKGGLFLFLKFPIGLTSWIVSVITFATSLAFICAPFDTYDGEIDLGFGILQDPTSGWLIAACGVLMLFATLHLHNAMGALWKFMARHLLNGSEEIPATPNDAPPPITQELLPA
jgi:hypothetical protein